MALGDEEEYFQAPGTAPKPAQPVNMDSEPTPEEEALAAEECYKATKLVQCNKEPARIELSPEIKPAYNPRELSILGERVDNPFLAATKRIFKATVVEDIFPYQLGVSPTQPRNVFELRAKYNDGVNWRDHKRHVDPPEKQARGDEQIQQLANSLAAIGYPLTEQQRQKGFAPELLKPEHRTWDEFKIELNLTKKGIGTRIDYLWQQQQDS